ncbi:hypothetical protein ACKUB1_10115 [Methanospirillum stamsii]|uniref:hypothetical protein n=1 Tax=Methanospirillum stamsii TaxID=1277351 RepID=UPI001C63DB4C|nr:hypothetical protein [Methanospirillum stamsii]
MSRLLSERDISLLKVLAPEFSGESCSGSGMPYHSLLPPVANHYAQNASDFRRRIELLKKKNSCILLIWFLQERRAFIVFLHIFFHELEERIREALGENTAKQLTRFYAMSCE